MSETTQAMKTNARANALMALRQAVRTVSLAAETASLSITRGCDEREELESMCQAVLHGLTWGFANATTSIETAMASTRELRKVELIEAKET